MAKKRRQRTWWYPVFDSQRGKVHDLQKITHVTDDSVPAPILFDSKVVAYGYAVGKRMDVKRDNDGSVITNEAGYAQLHDHGKITLIGIKGSAIDWKKVTVLEKPEDMKGDAISLNDEYEIEINKQTLERVYEESDDMYNRYAKSPLAQAGGILTDEPSSDAAEAVQPAIES